VHSEGGSNNLLAAPNITMHFLVRTEGMACLRHSELVFVVTRLLHAFTGFCGLSVPAPWLTSRFFLLRHFQPLCICYFVYESEGIQISARCSIRTSVFDSVTGSVF
jgi:uncharacterized membrane protein YtjA (UPF0391 family)